MGVIMIGQTGTGCRVFRHVAFLGISRCRMMLGIQEKHLPHFPQTVEFSPLFQRFCQGALVQIQGPLGRMSSVKCVYVFVAGSQISIHFMFFDPSDFLNSGCPSITAHKPLFHRTPPSITASRHSTWALPDRLHRIFAQKAGQESSRKSVCCSSLGASGTEHTDLSMVHHIGPKMELWTSSLLKPGGVVRIVPLLSLAACGGGPFPKREAGFRTSTMTGRRKSKRLCNR